jgi:N utilization substance protein B
MSRREIREQIFLILFRAEFHEKEAMKEQKDLFFEKLRELETNESTLDYMIHKVEQLLEKLDEIDAVINESVKGWKTSRMAKVDLTLLRLAVYEIRYEEDVPQGVAINEAVELAKKYGTDDSASFVNGVLAKIV